mgnify:CR=1 FL=1
MIALNVPVEVPPLAVIKTVPPPLEREFPAASFPVRVTVTLLPEFTVAEETVKIEVLELITPGVTVIVGIAVVTDEPSMIAPSVVAVPAKAPVNVAV